MSYQRKRGITRKHPMECDACEGFGQTRASETVMTEDKDSKLTTQHLGSGCLKCGRTGRLTPPSISQAEVDELTHNLPHRSAQRVARITVGRPSILALAAIVAMGVQK